MNVDAKSDPHEAKQSPAPRVDVDQLLALIQSELNEALVGKPVEVLVDSASRRRATELSGRTTQNVVVNLPGPSEWIGRLVRVRVERAGPHSVWGRALPPEPARAEPIGEGFDRSAGGA